MIERGEKTEDVVLVKLQSLAELRHTELVELSVELLEDIESVCDGLDDIVCFFTLHAAPPRRAAGTPAR